MLTEGCFVSGICKFTFTCLYVTFLSQFLSVSDWERLSVKEFGVNRVGEQNIEERKWSVALCSWRANGGEA